MGFRFRKSINLGGGVRINLSKSGVGYSIGTKGARITKTARGTTRKTFGIPGTGLSYSTETQHHKKRSTASNAGSRDTFFPTNSRKEENNMKQKRSFKNISLWVLTVFFAISALIYFPHIASFCMLLVALLLAPIRPLQDFIKRFINGKIKVLLAIILFILCLVLVPANEPTPEVDSVPATTEVETTEAPTTIPTTEMTEAPTTEATEVPTTLPATEATEVPATAPATEAAVVDEGIDYVLNTSSRKFHYPSCSSAEKIKDSNRQEFHGTRDELVSRGYSPCGRCHP